VLTRQCRAGSRDAVNVVVSTEKCSSQSNDQIDRLGAFAFFVRLNIKADVLAFRQ